MQTNTVAKNYIYNVVYRILILILPLITTPYVSRVLGAEGVGIYTYTISIVTYFILVGSLGIEMYAKREIAYVQEDKEKRSKVFWEILLLKNILLFISMVIFYFAFAVNGGEYSIYYKILILEILANMLDVSTFFHGMEEFKKLIKRNFITRIISIACVFIFVKKPTDVNIYLIIYVMATTIGNLSLWLYLPKFIIKVPIKKLELKKHLKPTITLMVPQIATQIYTILDKTMIGTIIADKSEVGYYEQAEKIVKTMLTIVTALGTVMLPRIANKFANGKEKEINKNIMKSFNFVYFISFPMIFGLLVVAKDFVPMFLGSGFNKSLYIIYLISPIILIIGLSNVIGVQYLLPTMRQNKYTTSVLVGAIVNLILNMFFIPKFLSLGAAISTIIAEIAVVGVQLYCIRKDYNIKEILSMSIKYFIAAIIMFIILKLFNIILLLNIRRVLRVAIDIIAGVILYLTSLIILKDMFIKDVINKIFKKKIIS